MSPKAYNKLIRDLIPEILQRENKLYEVVIMSEDEFDNALREKLIEEALEAKQAEENELMTELADVLEVIQSLMILHKIEPELLEAEQIRRRDSRGGFEKRLKLLWAD